ncbi:MAG: rSAM/selenodomain-associated transferase 1 [Patiriisocius sp.]|jgi:rSAM/selenodomain-associated transferase 1
MFENLLIILAKRPEKGKVKTRLAASIGDDKALEIYLKLLQHTHKVADIVAADKAVFYSDRIHDFDLLDYFKFPKAVQSGKDLGEKMKNAMALGFRKAYAKVILIGSDCITITPEIIAEAFERLDNNDVVIGPAEDGGYYLIGMKRSCDTLFENKLWSTSDVLLDTVLDLQKLEKSYFLLETLNDVDEEKDLNDELREMLKK